MAIWSVFVDDSGTHKQSPVAIAACFLSDRNRWARFDERWENARHIPGDEFDVFHMSEFNARDYDFSQWSDDKADRVITRLMDIIESCCLGGFIAAVVKEDYDKIVPLKLREKVGNYHYTFAFEACLALIEQFMVANHFNRADGVQYVFDRMSEGKHEIVDLLDDLLKFGQAPHFGLEDKDGYSFQSRAAFLPLQSADILAWNGYRYMLRCQLPALAGEEIEEAHPSFLRLINQVPRRVEIYTKYYDKQTLPEIVSEMSQHYDRVGWDQSPRGGFFPEISVDGV